MLLCGTPVRVAVRGLRAVGAQKLPHVLPEQGAGLLGPAFELEPVAGGDSRSRHRPEERQEPPVGMVRVGAPEHELALHPQELLRRRRLGLPSA